MRTTVLAIVATIALSACAEQQAAVPAPVDDTALTCSAIAKEREANDKALRITNDPYLASTNFTRATPFLDAHAKAPTLNARNAVLATLAEKRGC